MMSKRNRIQVIILIAGVAVLLAVFGVQAMFYIVAKPIEREEIPALSSAPVNEYIRVPTEYYEVFDIGKEISYNDSNDTYKLRVDSHVVSDNTISFYVPIYTYEIFSAGQEVGFMVNNNPYHFLVKEYDFNSGHLVLEINK